MSVKVTVYLTTHLKFSKLQNKCTRLDKMSFYKALPLAAVSLFYSPCTTYDRWHFDIFTVVLAESKYAVDNLK